MSDDKKNVTRAGEAVGKSVERTIYENANYGYPRRRVDKVGDTTTLMKDQGGLVRYITTKEASEAEVTNYHFYISYKNVDGRESALPTVKSMPNTAPGVVKLNTPATIDGLFDLYNSTTKRAGEEPSLTTATRMSLAEYGYTSLTTPVGLDSEGWIFAQSLNAASTPTRLPLVHRNDNGAHKYYFGNDLHGKLHFQYGFLSGSVAWEADGTWVNPDASLSRTTTCQPHTRLVDLGMGVEDQLTSRGKLTSQAILFDFARYYSPERGWPMLGRHGHIYKAPDGTRFLIYASSSSIADIIKSSGSKYRDDPPGSSFVIQAASLYDVTKNGTTALTTILSYTPSPSLTLANPSSVHTEFSPSGARVAFNVLSYPEDASTAWLDNCFWDIRLSIFAPYIFEAVLTGGSASTLPTASISVVRKAADMVKKTEYKGKVAAMRNWRTNEDYGHPVSGILTEMFNGMMNDYWLCEGSVTVIQGDESFITPKITKQTIALYASYGTGEALNVYDYYEEVDEAVSASYTIPSGTYGYSYKSYVNYHPVYLTPVEARALRFVTRPENALSTSNQHWTITKKTSLLKNGATHKESVYVRSYDWQETTATTLFFCNIALAWESNYTPKPTGGGTWAGSTSILGTVGSSVLSSNNTFVWTEADVIGIDDEKREITDPTTTKQTALTPNGEAEVISYPNHFPMDSDFRLWVSWNPITNETTHFHGERWV